MTGQPLLVAQITDLHIKPSGELAYGVVDTAAALARCVAHLNALEPRPAMVVCSGDLVDGGLPAEYDHLQHLLGALSLPLLVIPGNHDDRAALRRAFPDQPYAATKAANVSASVGDIDLVLLDSSVAGKSHGLLDAETLDWLDASLSAAAGRPALLFLHHPPFRTGITHMDRQNLQNAHELAAIVARHARVRLVAAGHVHRAVVSRMGQTPATICPAPNHAVDLDFSEESRAAFRIEPPAFHLHAWFAGNEFGNLVTHQVFIGGYDGPHPFFSKDMRRV
jgi:3',5'-cyclic AMP phosphodiesterase CpdA